VRSHSNLQRSDETETKTQAPSVPNMRDSRTFEGLWV